MVSFFKFIKYIRDRSAQERMSIAGNSGLFMTPSGAKNLNVHYIYIYIHTFPHLRINAGVQVDHLLPLLLPLRPLGGLAGASSRHTERNIFMYIYLTYD